MDVRGLSIEETAARDDGLALAADYLAAVNPLSHDQIQLLYDVILQDHAENKMALIALGIAFGDLIARRSGFDWVHITDEYGETIGLCHREALVACSPISMLEKRILNGDRIDADALCNATIKSVNDAVETGQYTSR